jgi:hypothetical protein
LVRPLVVGTWRSQRSTSVLGATLPKPSSGGPSADINPRIDSCAPRAKSFSAWRRTARATSQNPASARTTALTATIEA